MPETAGNFDSQTVHSFGDEWSRHRQDDLDHAELAQMFEAYFNLVDWNALPSNCRAFDMGTGTGRWARLVAPRVGELHAIDAAGQALEVARSNLANFDNVNFHHATTDTIALEPTSFDFGYSLGVLHHIPDTRAALGDCVRLLKSGGLFLVYLYYRFDNRPLWFRTIWHASDLLRRVVYRLPPQLKSWATDVIAISIYWPLSRFAWIVERLGGNAEMLPLATYRNSSVATLRTDSRDRFGTPLEQRFTRAEIHEMMQEAGLTDIRFSKNAPYWCVIGTKR